MYVNLKTFAVSPEKCIYKLPLIMMMMMMFMMIKTHICEFSLTLFRCCKKMKEKNKRKKINYSSKP